MTTVNRVGVHAGTEPRKIVGTDFLVKIFYPSTQCELDDGTRNFEPVTREQCCRFLFFVVRFFVHYKCPLDRKIEKKEKKLKVNTRDKPISSRRSKYILRLRKAEQQGAVTSKVIYFSGTDCDLKSVNVFEVNLCKVLESLRVQLHWMVLGNTLSTCLNTVSKPEIQRVAYVERKW